MTVGERIKHRRKQIGLSVDDVAHELGKDRATIYRYESNYIEKLPTTVLEPLSKVLKVTPAYLMGWDEIERENDILADIIIRLRSDDDFMESVLTLYELSSEQYQAIKAVLSTFKQQSINKMN